MPAYFFDASALVKRYLRETGSEWVRQLIAREQPRIFISSLSGVEVVAAIMRKERAGEIRAPERDKTLRAFRREFTTNYTLVPPVPPVINTAMDLLLSHALRAYDAVQLASALSLPPLPRGTTLIFVSADEQLLSITRTLGFAIENPNLHA